MKIRAVIFDLNGTVLADEYVYGAAFREVLRKLGEHIDSKYPHIGGIGVAENWPRLIQKYNIKTNKTIQELSRETQDAYLENIDKIELKKGILEFIEDLKNNGIKVGLATSNNWWVVEKVFDKMDIEDLFDSVTTGEEVIHKKPSPQIFTIAAGKLGIDPEACVVIEDSKAGVEAAHAAGMKVIGISRNKKHAKLLKEAEFIFDECYPDLQDLDITD